MLVEEPGGELRGVAVMRPEVGTVVMWRLRVGGEEVVYGSVNGGGERRRNGGGGH